MNGAALPDNPGFLPLFLRLKVRLGRNHLKSFRRHMWIHLGLALLAFTMLVGGGTLTFTRVFRFLIGQEIWGAGLIYHLINMIFLAFFSMLIFSNLIIMLTTTYLSREVEHLMCLPIVHRQLYFGKLFESVLYSSWAFVVLSCPLFIAMGLTWHLGWTFYLGAAAMIVPFVTLPAVIGSFVSLVISVWFPPRLILRFVVIMFLIGIAGALFAQRYTGISRMLGLNANFTGNEDIAKIMGILGVGDLLVLPSGWLGRGLTALQYQEWSSALFWMGALWSTAAMGVVALDWMAGPLYFRGWCSVRSSGTTGRRRSNGFYQFFNFVLRPVPSPTRALIVKDLTVFWRDPGQWTQLLILFGLLFIYMANIRSGAGVIRMEAVFPGWRTMLSMFNIGATTFVLSILTTRFVFPMLSLEGKQQWVIGLAPVGRTRLVWVKFIFSWVFSTAITLPLALFSSAMLETEPAITLLAAGMVMTMSIGLSALAVGMGALMPNFNDDNPARIASGLGGTINAVISLVYIGLSLALVAPWVRMHIPGAGGAVGPRFAMILNASIAGWIVLQLAATVIPMTLGLRRWRRMEF